MSRKPFTLRQAFIIAAAFAAGSTAGTLTEAIAIEHTQPGIGQLAAAATTLWVLDKLNALIDDRK
jgi:hypothetical protein